MSALSAGELHRVMPEQQLHDIKQLIVIILSIFVFHCQVNVRMWRFALVLFSVLVLIECFELINCTKETNFVQFSLILVTSVSNKCKSVIYYLATTSV